MLKKTILFCFTFFQDNMKRYIKTIVHRNAVVHKCYHHRTNFQFSMIFTAGPGYQGRINSRHCGVFFESSILNKKESASLQFSTIPVVCLRESHINDDTGFLLS